MRARSRFALLLFPLTLGAIVPSLPASAQTTLGQEALAETLFQDGRKLMEQGRFVDACPKLAESHRIGPAGGTVLLLALCYEQVGKTASAWLKFNEALAAARRDGRDDRADRSRTHIEKLEPQLSRITVLVPDEVASQPGFEVFLDGAALPTATWSRALPADPGVHQVEAKASGRRPWSATVNLGGQAARESVQIPVLEVLPAPEPKPVVPPVSARPAHTPPAQDSHVAPAPVLAYAVGGVGILALSFGGYYGLRALDRNADARDLCPSNDCTDPAGVKFNEDARRDATRANVLTGAGLLLVGVGAYLWLSTPDSSGSGTAIVATPGPAGFAIHSETRW